MQYEFHELSEIFPLIIGAEFDELVADIAQNGVREPVILFDGKILDGRNRYLAWEKAGANPDQIEFREFDGDDPVAFVVSANLRRRHMDDGQRAWVGSQLESMKQGRPGKDANRLVSREMAAGLLNVSERSLARAAVVRDQGIPELQQTVATGQVAPSAAAEIARLPKEQQASIISHLAKDEHGNLKPEAKTEIKRLSKEIRTHEQAEKKAKRQQREAQLGQKQIDLPQAKFGVIVADPEWSFEPYSRESGMDRAADNHYPTTATEMIAQRPVGDIAADDCALFLWATAPMLPDALTVMAAWGFTYKSHYIWGKDRVGTGYWARNKHELLLVGTKGNIPAPAMGDQRDSLIMAPVGVHSAKPEIFLQMIEGYFPTLPKIELNRRGPPRAGWQAWGNEAETDLVSEAETELTPQGVRGEGEAETPVATEASPQPEPEQASGVSHSNVVADVVSTAALPAADIPELPTFLRRGAKS